MVDVLVIMHSYDGGTYSQSGQCFSIAFIVITNEITRFYRRCYYIRDRKDKLNQGWHLFLFFVNTKIYQVVIKETRILKKLQVWPKPTKLHPFWINQAISTASLIYLKLIVY